MATTGLEVFDKTLQTTNIWLDEIMEEIGPDRQLAWHVLGAVLQVLRDRLPLEVAIHLGAQLPLLVRGTYYEQWHLGSHDAPIYRFEDLAEAVADQLGRSRPVNPATAIQAVFRTLARHVDGGQIAKVLAVLPASIRDALDAAAPG